MASAGFLIIGAGPAGLAAAIELARRGERTVVLEQDCQVGGLSRTVLRNGFRYDIGGHRFFTRNAEVEQLWREALGDELLRRRRMSRILYQQRFYHYPLQLRDALAGLGPLASVGIMGSYLKCRARPIRPEVSLEDWVTNRFGRALYRTFFQNYTQKVCGIPCAQMSADWSAQRIRNMNLAQTLLRALGIGSASKTASLIDAFDYPRLGPGQMYEAMAERARTGGATFQLSQKVTRLEHAGGLVVRVIAQSPEGPQTYPVNHVISSMPLSELAAALHPAAPEDVLAAARQLRYRSILTVNLVLRQEELGPDNWIYLHDSRVRAARMQLFKNWSPDLVPRADRSTVSLEYFVNEGDELWRSDDSELVKTASEDLLATGLSRADRIEDAFVVRYAKAYPIYDVEYRRHVGTIRRHLDGLTNLVCVGRYGQFRYNNMDHSILTALLGARRLLGQNVDPWAVNAEAQYVPEGQAG